VRRDSKARKEKTPKQKRKRRILKRRHLGAEETIHIDAICKIFTAGETADHLSTKFGAKKRRESKRGNYFPARKSSIYLRGSDETRNSANPNPLGAKNTYYVYYHVREGDRKEKFSEKVKNMILGKAGIQTVKPAKIGSTLLLTMSLTTARKP